MSDRTSDATPQRSGNHGPERVRHNFRIDLASGVLGATMFTVVAPFMPIVVRRMGGSEFEVSLVIAGAFIGHLLSPLGAYLLAGRPLVPVVGITGNVGRLVFIVAAAVATTPLVLALGYVGFWVVMLSNIAAYTMLMQRIYPDDQRATAMGRVRIGANLAGLVASLAGGVVLQVAPDPVRVLAVAAGISFVGNTLFLWVRHDEPAVRLRITSPVSLLPMVRRDPTLLRFLVASTVVGFGNLIGVTLYPLLLVDRFDAPNAFVGVYTAVSAAATMVGYWWWGQRIDRGSSIRLTLANAVLLLGIPIVYLLAPSTWALLPAAVLAGLTLGGGDLTFFANMVQLAPKGKAGDYMAAQSFTLGIRGTIAPFVASALLIVTNATIALAVVIVIVATGLVLLREVAARVDATRRAVEAVAT